MAATIFIKFCGFIVHSDPNTMALWAFPGKILVTRKIYLIFYPSPNVAHKPTDQSCSNSIFKVPLQLSPASHFRPTLNIMGTLILRVVNINKKRTERQTWNFTNMVNCFCCYVIKSAGESTKKVLLTVIWNLLLIERNLSQISISDNKREKVCAVCSYLLLWIEYRN